MDAVLRATAIYLILLLIFRLAGRRTLATMTPFEFVLLLIIGQATQRALLGEDSSVTNAALVITTLLFIDIVVSRAKSKSKMVSKIVDGVPVIIVEHGRPIREHMDKARVSEDEILESARRLQGIERMDQIRYAVLEITGGITVIPYER